ncbi:transglycosylase domain-containing protein, partial [Pseudophaeobacter sp.]|uniref:transglycosylase domain-containing protein n=1 Tax=Pseudophaeobacter sp. TaxID=1971739 RepID=UPI003297852D
MAVTLSAVQRLDRWVAETSLPLTLAETSTEVLDRNGALMRVYPVGDGIWRMAPQLEQVDPNFIAMLTAYEDKRFFSHVGVDPLAMLRAVGQALWNGRAVSGGSTLTMQLARLLEDGTTGAWAGKIRQIRLALALERRLSKRQILALYLTHAPYGGNLEGIRAASYAWFGKGPNRLTPSQAALLIALPQSPERRRPDRAPQAAQAARDRVLARLQGAGLLTAGEVATAVKTSVPRRMQGFPRLAPHLTDRLIASRPGAARLAVTLD